MKCLVGWFLITYAIKTMVFVAPSNASPKYYELYTVEKPNLIMTSQPLKYDESKKKCGKGYRPLEIYTIEYAKKIGKILQDKKVTEMVYISKLKYQDNQWKWESLLSYHHEYSQILPKGQFGCIGCKLESETMNCEIVDCERKYKIVCESEFQRDESGLYVYHYSNQKASETKGRCPTDFLPLNILNEDIRNNAEKALDGFNLHPDYSVLIGGDFKKKPSKGKALGFNPKEKTWVYFPQDYQVPNLCGIDCRRSDNRKYEICLTSGNWSQGQDLCQKRGHRLVESQSVEHDADTIINLIKTYKTEKDQVFFTGERVNASGETKTSRRVQLYRGRDEVSKTFSLAIPGECIMQFLCDQRFYYCDDRMVYGITMRRINCSSVVISYPCDGWFKIFVKPWPVCKAVRIKQDGGKKKLETFDGYCEEKLPVICEKNSTSG